MYRANIYGGRRGIGIHAMSGIDLALWDIKGKALGLPVWKLLGGGFTKSLRAYASSLFGATPAETGQRARRFADQGFTAVKFGWDPMGQDAETDVALVREARAGLGPDLDLMIDAGLVYDAKTAIQRARAFEPYNPFWFEEPLLPDDYEGYAKLAAATSLRIAAGEEESERKSFLQLMDVGKIDVVQVDLTRCGGFTEAIKIAALAADRGLPVVNHGFTTYLNVAAALHFLASIPNTLGLLEFVVEEGTTLRQSITEPIRAEAGRVAVPDAPGLGIELNAAGIEKFRDRLEPSACRPRDAVTRIAPCRSPARSSRLYGPAAAPDRGRLFPRDLPLGRCDPGRGPARGIPDRDRPFVRHRDLLPADVRHVLRDAPAADRGSVSPLPGRSGADAPARPGRQRVGDRHRRRRLGRSAAAGPCTAGSLARLSAGAGCRVRAPGRHDGAGVRLCRLRAGSKVRADGTIPRMGGHDPGANPAAMRPGCAGQISGCILQSLNHDPVPSVGEPGRGWRIDSACGLCHPVPGPGRAVASAPARGPQRPTAQRSHPGPLDRSGRWGARSPKSSGGLQHGR